MSSKQLLDEKMTKMELHYRNQRNKGLGVSLLGFVLAASSILLSTSFNNQILTTMVILGNVLALTGIYIYLKAYFSGIKYLKSEKYKQDLTVKQPWE